MFFKNACVVHRRFGSQELRLHDVMVRMIKVLPRWGFLHHVVWHQWRLWRLVSQTAWTHSDSCEHTWLQSGIVQVWDFCKFQPVADRSFSKRSKCWVLSISDLNVNLPLFLFIRSDLFNHGAERNIRDLFTLASSPFATASSLAWDRSCLRGKERCRTRLQHTWLASSYFLMPELEDLEFFRFVLSCVRLDSTKVKARAYLSLGWSWCSLWRLCGTRCSARPWWRQPWTCSLWRKTLIRRAGSSS